MRSFVHATNPNRVVFGYGTSAQVREEVERLGRTRALVLGSPPLAALGDRVHKALESLAAVRFDGAAMHTPVEVTEQVMELVREHSVDCVVAVGGGSTIGLAKAIAWRTGIDQVVLPTTYAGSEVTPVLGETAQGTKTTRSDAAILPETVLYDVEFTLDLPVSMSVTSGINAMAHAVEALYSQQTNPVVDGWALDSIRLMGRALPAIVADPADVDARAEALHAAWLAGTCLGLVGMGLHHKLCHTLGGSFDLPHAETHTVVLPHAMAYNAPAVPEVMRRIADALGTDDAPAGVHDLITSLDGPTSLRELGVAEQDLGTAAELATAKSYPNPRELTTEGIATLLHRAWAGERPASSGRPLAALHRLTEQVVASFDRASSPRLRQLLPDLVRHLHRFVADNDVTEDEWQYAIDFLTHTGRMCSDTRQEFVLLSDTLGVSSAVDLLTNSRTPEATPSAVLGPFYVEGPPAAEHGTDISQGLPGEPLWGDIKVTDTDGAAVPDAVVDVWQSNEDGYYDVQLPDLDGPVLRARFRTDDRGRFTFRSIAPSEYPIPDDGPVGSMLDAVGRHPYRAPHIHFMIMAPGRPRLITQLFVAGGAYLDSDAVFGVKDELIVDMPRQHGAMPDGRAVSESWRLLEFTFHIAADDEQNHGEDE
ncbi:maleylacetate reductase and hydroxyquinol 1,2-dioxygenase domain-containing protein [Haloactinomyces albus]|uniref:Alcohol dehydrogenase class IV/protocatechuate 3,4-dioxygenase beta subunit n=1 Tax=Haloactinomyces albus TaxID=1352928 RepID=A0AAE3ZHG1_9ACTN|nr:maleylacetate reductase and hydroxyquinol 1,2-dioxygenase domain-containing protein [Haloactinomyces albus]MDR7304095.1 alcohol dehydrogenase class IV/protocatechuate 3,4-dioxygenase beta subunit [Haloactinomyces albus]